MICHHQVLVLFQVVVYWRAGLMTYKPHAPQITHHLKLMFYSPRKSLNHGVNYFYFPMRTYKGCCGHIVSYTTFNYSSLSGWLSTSRDRPLLFQNVRLVSNTYSRKTLPYRLQRYPAHTTIAQTSVAIEVIHCQAIEYHRYQELNMPPQKTRGTHVP